ncbi:MAG TPA: acyloxyacyl hydrolase [Alphaproteobacteria bacterium]|nr:acyloxyacyl hydrolase [Alphaproteobacteria bacterium]MDP6269896.1 acyloxyacyl hydrolase [Alphaproteobacteria bacterium]HJM49686.1 acyloxyacyl hydrolase [Alphaproteobacteria bacterium]
MMAAMLAFSPPTWADDPAFVVLSLGDTDVKQGGRGVEARVEYRSDTKLGPVKPFAGLMATNERAVFVYGGVLLDVFFARRWVVTPSFAPGAYGRGGGKELGHWIEFRTQIDIAYRFDDRARLGLSVGHISNGGVLSSHNPGTESLMLTFALPFGVPNN